MTTFRMLATVEFNRPINKDTDYISPGGYEMVMNGQPITFDFEYYEGWVDDKNPSLFHYQHKDPDYDTFEDLELVTEEMLNSVEAIEEFYIFTGEGRETDLRPIAVKALSFTSPYNDFKEIEVKDEVIKNAKLFSAL